MQSQFQEIKDILASCQDQLNALTVNTSKTIALTNEEKEKYFEIDLIVRLKPNNINEATHFKKDKALIPKDIFAHVISSPNEENYENETLENMLSFLNPLVQTTFEKVYISQITREQLIPFYKEYKLKYKKAATYPINKDKFYEFIRTLDPECKKWKDLSIYKTANVIFQFCKYASRGRKENRCSYIDVDPILKNFSEYLNTDCDSKLKIIIG